MSTPDTLTIALEKVDFFPSTRVTDDTSILTLKNLVMEPLCRWQDGQVTPGLLASWQVSEDGRQWRFEIRPGARFHDGQACRAEHILAYLDGILQSTDTFGMPWAYSRYFAGARFSALGATTLGMQCDTPIADILEIFSEFFICRSNHQQLPVLGTGPYRVTDFTAGREARLQRVGEGAGPQHLVLLACHDAQARHELLRSGAVDVATHLERSDRPLDFAASWTWLRRLNTLSVMQYLNASSGIFQHPLARLAVNHAVDAQAIVDDLFQGLGQPAATVVSPWHNGYRQAAITPIAYDPHKARALLDQVGGSAEVLLRTPEYMPDKARQITEQVLHALQAVGLRGRIEVQQDRPEYARQIGRKQMGDVAIFDSSPHSTFRVLNDKISSQVRGSWWQGYHDAELEPLMLQANRCLDNAQRAQAYGRCLARLNQNPPWLYLFHPVVVAAARPGVLGLALGAKGDLLIAS
ncbi:ABC transporter substrate-binding protein [Pseudomonas putida]